MPSWCPPQRRSQPSLVKKVYKISSYPTDKSVDAMACFRQERNNHVSEHLNFPQATEMPIASQIFPALTVKANSSTTK